MSYIIAHRGFKLLPRFEAKPVENTIDAFKECAKYNPDYVEFDLRKDKYGEIIVFHDENIEEARGNGILIPTYEELLKLFKGTNIKLDIELKEAGFEEETLNMTLKYFKEKDFIVKSFIPEAIKKIKELNKKVKTAFIIGEDSEDMTDPYLKTRMREIFPKKMMEYTKADFIACHNLFYDKLFISRFYPKYKIIIWNVKDLKDAAKYMKKNVWGIVIDNIRP